MTLTPAVEVIIAGGPLLGVRASPQQKSPHKINIVPRRR
jgi:hypothetical protein